MQKRLVFFVYVIKHEVVNTIFQERLFLSSHLVGSLMMPCNGAVLEILPFVFILFIVKVEIPFLVNHIVFDFTVMKVRKHVSSILYKWCSKNSDFSSLSYHIGTGFFTFKPKSLPTRDRSKLRVEPLFLEYEPRQKSSVYC